MFPLFQKSRLYFVEELYLSRRPYLLEMDLIFETKKIRSLGAGWSREMFE